MNKLIVFTTITIICLIIIVPLSLVLLIKYIPSGIQPALKDTEKIYESFVLSQEFISIYDNLVGIGVSIKNPNYKNKKEVKLRIYDNEDRLVRTANLRGQNIADGEFVSIMFDPIIDSKEQRYIWSIESADSTMEDALEIFLTDQKPVWSLDFKVAGEKVNYGLSYVTFHKVNPGIVLNAIYSEWHRNFIDDRVFAIFYISIILIIVSSLGYISIYKKEI